MVAALAVPVPGFPIPRAQLALAASATGEPEIEVLILPAWVPDTETLVASGDYQARKKALSLTAGVTDKDRAYMRRRRALAAACES